MKKSFEEWFRNVDAAVAARVGLSVNDLPDMPYRDMYDNGVSAKSAAAKAIKSAKDEM